MSGEISVFDSCVYNVTATMQSALPSTQLLCNCTASWLWPIFVLATTVPSGPWPPHCRDFMITLRHTTLGGNTLDEWSARLRGFYLTTPETHSRHPCPGEIRTRNPNNSCYRPRLRTRSHWDRRWPSLVRKYRRQINKYGLYPIKTCILMANGRLYIRRFMMLQYKQP